jgi:aspartyl-tRNA(Asn)/glutamyl-tRNA(Gln) amidotransferase subunit A
MSSLNDLTVTTAGDLLSSGRLTATELLEHVLAQVAGTEPSVHAYACVLEEEARSAAAKADEELAAGRSRGPLHGIPIGVKDVFWTKDGPSEAGSRILKGFRPAEDATAVRRMRDAGAIVVGKHHTHEFALGHGDPPTENAWKAGHYPGGSSAGAGASVAVGSSLVALGTDAGGSVRKPASLNGVVGLKPTQGRISRYGIIPPSGSLDHVGIVTRTVEDSALVLGCLAEPDESSSPLSDHTVIRHPVDDYVGSLSVGIDGMRVGILPYFFGPELDSEVRGLVEDAISTLTNLGVTMVSVDVPSLSLTMPAGVTLVLAEGAAAHLHWLRERPSDYFPETRQALELGALLPWVTVDAAQRARAKICSEIGQAIAEHRLDAIVAPTLPETTFPLDRIVPGEEPYWAKLVRYTIPANLTGLPALTVPCGFTSADLPAGLQIYGRPFHEATVLRIGHAYQQRTAWHERRPPAAVPAAA